MTEEEKKIVLIYLNRKDEPYFTGFTIRDQNEYLERVFNTLACRAFLVGYYLDKMLTPSLQKCVNVLLRFTKWIRLSK
tara:strand:+ start:201 stop:434 length:234 start_codon:yes stop_codon:yes gene_type:complete